MTCLLQTVDVISAAIKIIIQPKNALLTMSGGAEQFVDVVDGEGGLVTARALEHRTRERTEQR